MNRKRKYRNLLSSFLDTQTTGRKLGTRQLPTEFLNVVDKRLKLRGIPHIISQLERYSVFGRFSVAKCLQYLKELHDLLQNENPVSTTASSSAEFLSQTFDKFTHGKTVRLFGGIEVILHILLYPTVHGFKNNLFTPGKDQICQLRCLCLETLHIICVTTDSIAVHLGRNDQLINHLFLLMSKTGTFMCASAFLEDLLNGRKRLIDLRNISNLRELVTGFSDQQLANFCRNLSYIVTDYDALEGRKTLIAEDADAASNADQKVLVESNQGTLLSIPVFLGNLCRLAKRPLSEGSSLHSLPSLNVSNEFLSTLLLDIPEFNFNIIEEALEDESMDVSESSRPESSTSPVLSPLMSIRIMHEVMYKVEVTYIMCLFLTGKHKSQVQKQLTELKLIPGLCDMFEKFMTLSNRDQISPGDSYLLSEHFDYTAENALKVQFLRLVHSFCDYNENKHILLSPSEFKELKEIYDTYELEMPEAVKKTKRNLCCQGEKGLLTKILEVLKKVKPNGEIRFWLSRAIEGFLRGKASTANQLFLMKKGLLEMLIDHIASKDMKAKQILQSSFDLLGEVMKFNIYAFQRFDSYISEQQYERFMQVMTSNVVDSNMFIRCMILSSEHFKSLSRPQQGPYSHPGRLQILINTWDQKMYLLYKLINCITVDNLTQENVSCLNTSLIFLMIGLKSNYLHVYLKGFLMEEKVQRRPGMILNNLRNLLAFWKVHYSGRNKDRSALEQSSGIGFEEWFKVVDILLAEDSSNPLTVAHYLGGSLTRQS